MSGTSPASSGPAGPRFEGQVGAYYLLSMLACSEPRGLPGTSIDRAAFQRADEGFPLDDVIIHAHDAGGALVMLQIQVKRSIQFSPSDDVFKKVVGQIAEAIKDPAFWSARNELAIATARTSRKIDGSYQDVLMWARQLGSAAEFFARLARPGSANDDMRIFVQTFRDHLRDAGAPHDEETVRKTLARLQILVFDFTATGSATEELARDRAAHVLPPEDRARAASLWSTLTDLALEVAANGGDRDRARLIADLQAKDFRLTGDRRFETVRAAVAEAARHALADIDDRVGNASLARIERTAAVHAALDEGRYVEIRGDAGVGKSGVLKHFAELSGSEARVVVLSPGRTPAGGWSAMRGQLGFDGTAREILADLTTDGAAALFVDNLDSFDEGERRTVNDLVREAVDIPGLSVVVTTRRNFGDDEPSWLPKNAVDALRRAPPVVIDDLSSAEVLELADAEPRLAGLLADNHPARDVVRNLYRLSRLANRPASQPTPTTELDMAEQWWSTADGRVDAGLRDRARLLRDLAEQSLSGAFSLDVRDKPAAAIDALIHSESLRDRGNDRVTFRHDVLRQWAIGNLLYADETAVSRLPLDRPASDVMARGVELSARFALEREVDGARWSATLATLTGEKTHGSWRRAALLALVRSEAASKLLKRESDRLLANDSALLCELMRTVMAVDVEPASRLFVRKGVDPALIPSGVFVPTNASWVRLILWLLKLGAKVPAKALPDVVELYSKWSIGNLGSDRLTPKLLAWLHAWLVELEDDQRSAGSLPRSYSGQFENRDADGLIDRIRTGFLTFCNMVPALAVDYLDRVSAQNHNRHTVSSIFKFRGALAQAAPKQLAELTFKALVRPSNEDDLYRAHGRRDPFHFIDRDFRPESPAQGPFLELLTHAPEEGLCLIRALVNYAIQFTFEGKDPGDDGFTIEFDEGARFFPWKATYFWPRGQSRYSAIASGLMALESWAHRRVEAGEDFGAVLKDVLGPPGTSAAFLLVSVDLLLSHWPKSTTAATPFLGCPELLSCDRARHTRDQMAHSDLSGITVFRQEPKGSASRSSLKERPSRTSALEDMVKRIAIGDETEVRKKIEQILRAACQRLGPPDKDSDFDDPRFMVQHALYLFEPDNWTAEEVELKSGGKGKRIRYVAPKAEADHLAALNAAAATNVVATLLSALDNRERSSPELASQGVAWAQSESAQANEHSSLRADAIPAAALIAIRDGTDDLRAKHGAWAEKVLTDALNDKDDVDNPMHDRLAWNPVAMGFVGIADLYRRDPSAARLRTLLQIAARENPAGAHGFFLSVGDLVELDERLPKAILRCAFACIRKPVRYWKSGEAEATRRAEAYQARQRVSVQAELAWLTGAGPEPEWPSLESEGTRRPVRRRPVIPVGGYHVVTEPEEIVQPAETYIDHQAAALWLRALRPILDVTKRPWLREVASFYADFTAKLNGLGLELHDEVSENPSEWNDSYYELLSWSLVGLSKVEIEELALRRIIGLPNKSFYDVTSTFLRAVDTIYFSEHLLEQEGPFIRQQLIDRLVETYGWRNLIGKRSGSIENHLGLCVGTVLFNNYLFGQTRAYLTPDKIEMVDPYLPKLIELVTKGPSYFVALATMELLEVSPHPSMLPLMIAGASAWLKTYVDDTGFWIGYGIGRRFCDWIEHIRSDATECLSSNSAERQEIDRILAALVQLGLPEARQLENKLALP